MSIEKRLERLEKVEGGKNPDPGAIVIYHTHTCGEPTPEAGEPERNSPVCEACGTPLYWVFGNSPPEGASVVYRIPDNGREGCGKQNRVYGGER